jgi:hypothetical protein
MNISKDDMLNLASNIYNVVFASTSVQPKLQVRKSSKDKYFRVQKPRTSNGKTSIVRYRTLSFFAFRFFKKRMFAFFRDFKCKISIEPVPFASILVHV